jgi:uncharacterized radical SAM superfamily Fe-S cluster-containing enzyme
MFTSKTSTSYAIANGVWKALQPINRLLGEGNLPTPKWAPGPLLKRAQRRPMELGVPRKTLSLCPDCNREAAEAVLNGQSEIAEFRDRPGIIDSEILEEGGRILMRKACPKHGPFEDVLSNHPDFSRRMEGLVFGGDFECAHDQQVHDHGPHSLRSGRGSYLIVDLTNRCNMKCSPCFMDANAVGYVHELDLEDLKALFNNAVSFKPQREINVLFSGGEPTLSPIFLEAVQHAKSAGFDRLHVVTNGIRLAESRDFVFRARAAGLHGVYLQYDGASEEQNQHRGLGNYMEVKRRALENIAAAGMKTTLQVTVVNGLNNHALGDIVRFAIENTDKIHGVLFQPVMFTGRDERISTEERYARRYPVSQLAFDLEEQTSMDWQPLRDWFPASACGIFAHLCDVLNPEAELGSLFPATHPNHGVFSPLLVDTDEKTAIPIPAFFNLEQFMRDVVEITDRGRGPRATRALAFLSLLRNFDQRRAPSGFGPAQLLDLLEDCFYRVAGGRDHWSQRAYSYNGRWRVMMINGMWFQDAFNYDFSTLRNSFISVETRQGEISFCAYNGGGWRKVVEHLDRTTALAEWHRKNPRHEIYAHGKKVEFGRPIHGRAETPLVQIEGEALAVPAKVSDHRE